jgi:hypothetical protein
MDITLNQTILHFQGSRLNFNYELKRFQASNITFKGEFPDMTMDTESLLENLNGPLQDSIKDYVNRIGSRSDNMLNLTWFFRDRTYLPFWTRFFNLSNIEFKHQYMRMKFDNGAIVLPSYCQDRSPLIDYLIWMLQNINKHNRSNELTENSGEFALKVL